MAIERNTTYDVISVVYHALKGAETCTQYLEDARSEGASRLERFFGEVIRANEDLAAQGKMLLREQLRAAAADEKVDESSRESFPASDAPAQY